MDVQHFCHGIVNCATDSKPHCVSVHPEVSLHYWDWNSDPSNMRDGDGQTVNLFDAKEADFMGNAELSVDRGSVGEPLFTAGFYLLNPGDPDPADGKFRTDELDIIKLNRPDPSDPSTWSYPTKLPDNTPVHYNPADAPKTLSRSKRSGPSPVGTSSMGWYWPTDKELIKASTWDDFNDLMQGVEIPPRGHSKNGAHAGAHSYIGGNLDDPHVSFRDPFVFLVHSNVDRLWAMWRA